MTQTPSVHGGGRARDDHDRCPGVAAPHAAADGALARIRLPGGQIQPAGLEALAAVADRFGDGHIELTSRANLQLRAITDVECARSAVATGGLLPAPAVETQRNIAMSPMTGRRGGIVDVRPLVAALDDAIVAGAAPARLSGRFWFGLDDGRGDVVALGPDVVAVAGDRDRFVILVADVAVGTVSTEAVVATLLQVAHRFAESSASAWRVRDLSVPDATRLRAQLSRELAPGEWNGGDRWHSRCIGWFEQTESTGADATVMLGATLPLGRIPARTAQFLAAVGAPMVVTAHREILLCDLSESVADTVVRVLAPMGVVFDAASPWAAVTSCAGSPGCSRALAPVRTDAADRVAAARPGEIGIAEHWVGCARGCGSPAGAHIRVEATGDGYRRSERGASLG